MDRAAARRRRLAGLGLALAAAGAFAIGAATGNAPSKAGRLAPLRLTPPQLAGERIVTGFEGTAVPPELASDVRKGLVAGVILFAENLPSRGAARRLIGGLQAIRRPPALRQPLLVMVDQEGGLVKRLAGPPSASAAEMGSRGGAFSRRQGARTAASLRAAGFNVDLAPVLDVARPGGFIAETERGFGSTAARVEATAIPFARGLEAGGVAATAKHFPGLGAAHLNTDEAAQTVRLPVGTLRSVDEAPYRPFAEAGGSLVMLSTAIFPALDSRPAAFSPVVLRELRERAGFNGVTITDALEAASVRAFGGPDRAALAAARAGTDLLLFTDPAAARSGRRALVSAIRRGSLDRGRFEASARRVLELRGRLGPGGL
jgi:beta-N-acetylhexosaminidase